MTMAVPGKDTALITAGIPSHYNAMSIKYGAIGNIWGKETYFAFVKPERYTWEFIKENDYYTISFFPKEYSHIHKIFGCRSGRDTDKVKETGITPEFLENGISFTEANEIYVCRKIYTDQFDLEKMPSYALAKYNDPNHMLYGQAHYMIMGEIVEHILR